MEPIPFVDEHSIRIAATEGATWQAMEVTLTDAFSPRLPRPIVRLWGLEESGPMLGFHVAAAEPPRLWSLVGRHRFARYELRFELLAEGAGTVVRARSYAAFAGVLGAAYRTLVIRSGGHRRAVRGMLAKIARRAKAAGAPENVPGSAKSVLAS